MISKREQIEIPYDNPFFYDRLGRKNIADNLTKIIRTMEGSFVLGIDSPWGTGKTTFIKMWQTSLSKTSDIFTIYFNAWENDFHNNPLISLIGELDQYIEGIEHVNKDDIKKLFGTISSNLVKKISLDIIDLEKLYSDLNSTENRKLLNKYREYNEVKNLLKESLVSLKKKLKVRKMLFFIDELDRCRPDYAIQMLERIKHLFDIDDYIFVLSLDKTQLSHSVATLYGQNMDSLGYLKRFIDFEFILPEQKKEEYLEVLKKEYSLLKFNDNTYLFWKFLSQYINYYNFSLRDIDKLFYFLKVFLPITPFWKSSGRNTARELNSYFYVNGLIYSLFISLKIKNPDLYSKIYNKNYKITDIDEIISSFDKVYSDNKELDVIHNESLINILRLNLTFVSEKNDRRFNKIADNHEWLNSVDLKDFFDRQSGNLKVFNEIEFLENFKFEF